MDTSFGTRDPASDAGEAFTYRVEIERAHMEEDTGKSTHVGGTTGRIHGAEYSLVDYNRAGVPPQQAPHNLTVRQTADYHKGVPSSASPTRPPAALLAPPSVTLTSLDAIGSSPFVAPRALPTAAHRPRRTARVRRVPEEGT